MTDLIIKHSMIQLLLMVVLVCIASASQIAWTDFVKDPNAGTYVALLESLKICNRAAKCVDARPDTEAFFKFLELVKAGNAYAVDIAVLSRDLRLFDGGNLEDMIRALGQLAETHPRLLLSSLQKYNITGYSFASTFVMLPLETVDDINARIRTVKKRIDSLSTVTDDTLRNERDNAIILLKQRLDRLQEVTK